MGSEFAPGAGMAARPLARLASARQAAARRRSGAGARPQQSLSQPCLRCTSSIARAPASNGWLLTTPTTACLPGCAKAATVASVAWSSSISRRKSIATIAIKVPFAGAWREVLNTDAAIYGGSNVGNAGRDRRSASARARVASCRPAAGGDFSGSGALDMRLSAGAPRPAGRDLRRPAERISPCSRRTPRKSSSACSMRRGGASCERSRCRNEPGTSGTAT